MKRGRKLWFTLFWILAPWMTTATLFFGARGQWISALGCCLAGGAMAALGLDAALWSKRSVKRGLDRPLEGDQRSR